MRREEENVAALSVSPLCLRSSINSPIPTSASHHLMRTVAIDMLHDASLLVNELITHGGGVSKLDD
jgi:hypothetical protein